MSQPRKLPIRAWTAGIVALALGACAGTGSPTYDHTAYNPTVAAAKRAIADGTLDSVEISLLDAGDNASGAGASPGFAKPHVDALERAQMWWVETLSSPTSTSLIFVLLTNTVGQPLTTITFRLSDKDCGIRSTYVDLRIAFARPIVHREQVAVLVPVVIGSASRLRRQEPVCGEVVGAS